MQKYAIALAGIALGAFAFMGERPRSVGYFTENQAQRDEVIAACSARTHRGKECDNARMAAVRLKLNSRD